MKADRTLENGMVAVVPLTYSRRREEELDRKADEDFDYLAEMGELDGEN